MKKVYKKSLLKKITSVGLVFSLAVSSLTVSTNINAYSGTSGEYSRYERLKQPSVTTKFEANELAVVNFETKYGDKAANIASMTEYIEKADKAGVKVLLFPEMCVTGYVSSSDPKSESYQWAVESAEPLDGPTAKYFAEIADEDDMWIIYGATQTVEGDSDHAYNSAFICSPEGEVTAYQKITPVEGSWCVAGETPVIIDAGDCGKIGVSICFDTYSTPELERYYAAMGCNILVNPTATGGGWSMGNMDNWQEYYKLRLESIASRDGFTILSSDLVGVGSDTKDSVFPGGSVILQGTFSGANYYAGATVSDGSSQNNAEIVTAEEGLLTNSVALTAKTGTTTSNKDFNPEMYASLYKDIADAATVSGGTIKYSPTKTEGPKVAMVNMTGYWGNKKKTLAKMIDYIEEAGKQDVDMIVFPETVLNGYGYLEPEKDPFYQKYGVSMQVYTAETIPGATTNTLSEYAQKYGMYIIFGMTEKDESGAIYENGVEKVYNAAAILYPDGTMDSYQKIHRAGMESEWSVPGSTPKMVDTEWGKIGIDICMDGHFFPELGRYYAAMGCTMFIHPTATGGNAWYRQTRIASYTDRDGMAAITCNLLGGDGIYTAPGDTAYDPKDTEGNFDSDGNFIGGSEIPEIIYNPKEVENDPYWDAKNWTGGIFSSTSFISTKGSTSETNPTARINYNGTGPASEGFEERGKTSPLGLEIATMNLKGTGFSATSQTYNPSLYSKLYDKLAVLYREGYTSLYGKDAVAEPVTVKLTTTSETPIATTPVVTGNPTTTTSPAVSQEPTATTAPAITGAPQATTSPAVTVTPGGITTDSSVKAPAKGTKLKDTKTKAVYKVTKAGSTVQYVKTTAAKAKSIVIPAKVTISGVTYKVTSVASKALKGNKKVTKLTIGKNVTKIGAKAFYGCKNLKKITIKTSSLKAAHVGAKAFKGIYAKVKVSVPTKKLTVYKKILKKAGLSAKATIKK